MAKDTGTLDTGNWAAVREERDDFALPVKGELPRELSGTLFRNGPNPQFDTPDAHWFVGDGTLDAFTLDHGRASYRDRWVRTPKCAGGGRVLGAAPRPTARARSRGRWVRTPRFGAEHDAGRAIWSGAGFGGQR